ncbi:hypothetical protein ACFQH5_15615 [Halomonas salifodinae]|uniref:Uncharacterized protein n=1 Tax=Halomonas salifodinae TaxID=438745 RepID=A0ABW2F1T5_9GAMM
MDIDFWLLIGIFILGAGSLLGFFFTKTEGFGRFTTSTFLIILVIVISSLLYAAGKLEGQVMANVLFAVFGFAGGLFTSKNGE